MKANYIIKHLLGTLLFFTIIFICAGHINYWQGIIYVILGLFMSLLNYTVLKIDPELIEERSKAGEGAKKWDKKILGLSFLAAILMYCMAGLDSGRYHWSPDFHISLIIMGIILTALGQLLFLIAQKQNKFFSSTVRIQTERGHTVCDTGLYKFVRHPAYMGTFIQTLGFPLLFGSLWSIIPVCFSIILLIVRTNLEDQTLKSELSGYTDYANRTRFKLIPFIW
jgi:protein-S-isoprenylcysteine O-methyltransferase Ste14